jgi:hypothetical protein
MFIYESSDPFDKCAPCDMSQDVHSFRSNQSDHQLNKRSTTEKKSLIFSTKPCGTLMINFVSFIYRVIFWFLLKETVNADDIQRRFQALFIDDTYGIRSVRCWCQFIRQRREDLHDDPRSGHPPSTLSTPKFCQHWSESYFILHTHSLRL